MHKLAATVVAALAFFAFTAVPALAASGPAVTSTQTDHFSWQEWAINPVTEHDIYVTFDGTAYWHETSFPGTDQGVSAWGATARISFVDDGVTFTGRASSHGAGKVIVNSVETSTLNVHATGSDGSSLWIHETMHFTYNANGVMTVTF